MNDDHRRIRDLEHALAAERGRAAGLQWLINLRRVEVVCSWCGEAIGRTSVKRHVQHCKGHPWYREWRKRVAAWNAARMWKVRAWKAARHSTRIEWRIADLAQQVAYLSMALAHARRCARAWKGLAKRERGVALRRGQDCDILEAASTHWQAECARAEQERDEARTMWAANLWANDIDAARRWAGSMWGAAEAKRLFPVAKGGEDE